MIRIAAISRRVTPSGLGIYFLLLGAVVVGIIIAPDMPVVFRVVVVCRRLSVTANALLAAMETGAAKWHISEGGLVGNILGQLGRRGTLQSIRLQHAQRPAEGNVARGR